MNLKVIPSKSPEPAWYTAGLRFTCTQCGNCCTGGPGYVWISEIEIDRLAKHLKLTADEVIERYGRRVGNRVSLQERKNSRGEYDCIFLSETKATNSKNVVFTRRTCSIYEVRPLQCRTWPFWEGNLLAPESWARSAERCHGMNYGSRIFTKDQIHTLRDAKDWPKKPPTSE